MAGALLCGNAAAFAMGSLRGDRGEREGKPRFDPEMQRALLAPFACNIELWFRDLPFEARFAAAAEAGFSAVEFWNPRKGGALTVAGIAEAATRAGLEISTFAPPAPDMGDPGQMDDFLNWAEEAVTMADQLNVRDIVLIGHRVVEGVGQDQLVDNYSAALERAAPIFEGAGKRANIEAFNPYGDPGFFLYGVEPALSICREIDSHAVRLTWDFFHIQRTDGDVVAHFERAAEWIGYVQFADTPTRHQPGTGELNYGYIFSEVRRLGYEGRLGAELLPEAGDAARAAEDLAVLSLEAGLVQFGGEG